MIIEKCFNFTFQNNKTKNYKIIFLNNKIKNLIRVSTIITFASWVPQHLSFFFFFIFVILVIFKNLVLILNA